MSLYWMERDFSFYGVAGNHSQTQTSPPIWINESRNQLAGSVSPQSPMSSGSSHCSPTANCSSTTLCSSTETVFPTAIRKIRNVRKSDKHHCTVCGDRPTGYHYDVLSCNGCKTFFRRTIINNRTFACTKGGNCEFTKDFRCACRACRFDKCVRVGMNPSSIQFPSSKNNADGDENDSADEDGNDKSVALLPLKKFTLKEGCLETYRWVDEIFRRENSVLRLRQPGVINMDADMSLTTLLSKSCGLGTKTADIKPGVLYIKDPVRYWMVADLHLLVEFAKSFEAFQHLGNFDQKCLISHIGGVLHVATQSFYSYFESKSATLTFPDGINALQSKMAAVKQDDRKPQISSFRRIFVKYYTEMYSSPVDELLSKQISMIEYAFFKAISMFSPDNMEMSFKGKAIVNAERARLTNLLRSYLIAEHGFKNGVARLSTILMAVSTFVTFGEKRRNYISLLNLLDFDLAQIGKDIYLNKPSEMQ